MKVLISRLEKKNVSVNSFSEFPDDFVYEGGAQEEEDKIYDDLCALRLTLDQVHRSCALAGSVVVDRTSLKTSAFCAYHVDVLFLIFSWNAVVVASLV